MKKKKSWYSDDELNVWQPASDMFSALLLILMLVILLLGLYLIHIPEHSQLDPYAGDTYAQGSKEQAEATNTNTPQPTLFFWLANGAPLLLLANAPKSRNEIMRHTHSLPYPSWRLF